VGVVLIGQMLNTYYKARPGSSSLQTPLVAEARQTLFRNGEEDAGAVIALNNMIVASSVPPASVAESATGPPLIGVLRDAAKAEEVFRVGARGYNVAWQPLKSIDGTANGAVGVVRPSRELDGSSDAVSAPIILVGAIATLAAGAAGFIFGLGLGARLNELTQAASRWTLGELSTPVRDREPFLARWVPAEFLRDEINQLAEQLDQMRESFRQAIERMRKR
jgi:HAMP domain-containing protein